MAGRRVLLVGLGTFGGQVAVARHLAKAGDRVTVTDKKPKDKLESSVRELDGLGIDFRLGEHEHVEAKGYDLVVRSPAVPLDHELVKAAAAARIPVTTEIVLTLARLRAPYAAVTGTKGKSTTTALLGRILEETKRGPVWVGGNLGRPLLEAVDAIPETAQVVYELSSFMAEDLALARRAGERVPAPRVLVVTSLAPEHLDRHGTKEAYYEAKLSLMDGMSSGSIVVFDDRGELGELLPPRARARGLRLIGLRELRRDGDWVLAESGEKLFQVSSLKLAGEHNVRNAALAAHAALELGAPPEAIARGVASFEALPHRLSTVATDRAGRAFVNDSIATTPEAAQAALAAFAGRPVVLMLGGSDKGSDFSELAKDAARAHAVVCLGATGPRLAGLIAKAIEERRGLFPTRVVEAQRFEDAFALARELCPEGGVVLLSPACASYDQFKNFEERGERFAALARAAASR